MTAMAEPSRAPVRAAVLDDYQGVALTSVDWSVLDGRAEVAVLRGHLGDDDGVVAGLQGVEVAVAMRERTAFPRSVLERLPDLRLLVTTGMRNAAIDLAAARDLGIVVCGTGGTAYDAAELTWALLMAAARRLDVETANMRAGRWMTTVGTALEGSGAAPSVWSASAGWAAGWRATASRSAWRWWRGART